MKHMIIAVAFAVATLTACTHKPAAAPVVDAKVVKTPVCKKACKKAN